MAEGTKDFTYKEFAYIFFSIFYILDTILEYFPNYRHNDLKVNNILV